MAMHNILKSEASFLKKRGHLQIMFEVLKVCEQPQSRTHVMYKANLSHNGMLAVLQILEKYKLLEVTGDSKKKYTTSAKGKEYLQKYVDLQKLTDSPNKKTAKDKA
jgi:predicted transcriptional regulator